MADFMHRSKQKNSFANFEGVVSIVAFNASTFFLNIEMQFEKKRESHILEFKNYLLVPGRLIEHTYFTFKRSVLSKLHIVTMY